MATFLTLLSSLLAALPATAANLSGSATVGEPFELQAPGTAPFALSAEPEGMTINPRTGLITWTPAPGQGSATATVSSAGGGSDPLTVSVTAGSPDLTGAVFVSPAGDNGSGDGSPGSPYEDTRKICPSESPSPPAGTVIYFRGGTYRNPDFGAGLDNGQFPQIRCTGSIGDRVLIRPWGNEKPKLEFDGGVGFRLVGDHLELQGFEIEGRSAEITLQDALDNWWLGDKYFNGNGLIADGADITIRENYIHDVPAAGINTNSGADGLRLLDNMIANTSWWSIQGTTAMGFVGIDDSGIGGIPKIEASGNVAMRSESRVISHVFSKGFVEMTIDEGSSMLIKGDDGNYARGFDVTGNLFLYNGKGISLRDDAIDFANNTMLDNGTTLEGGGAGARSNGATNLTLADNAIEVQAGKNAVDFSEAVTLTACTGNLFDGEFSSAGDCEPPAGGNASGSDLFTDPANGDFSVKEEFGPLAGPGVGAAGLAAIAARLTALGIEPEPTGHCVDLFAMRETLIANRPQPSTVDRDSIAPDVLIEFPDDTNPTGLEEIELRMPGIDPSPRCVELEGVEEGNFYRGSVGPLTATGGHDGSGIAEAELLVDGTAEDADTSEPFDSLSFQTPPGQGTLELQARLTDGDGSTASSDPISIGFDNLGPELAITSGPGGGSAPEFSFTADDPRGISQTSCRFDAGQFGACSGGFADGSGSHSASLPPGPHSFSVRTTDGLGNISAAETSFTVEGVGPAACSNRIRGTRGNDRLRGTRGGDKINGGRGRDRIDGRSGDDCLAGKAGRDRIKGGKGKDRINGGKGRDRINSRDGVRDLVKCGPGRDRVKADRSDRLRGCEKVRRL